MKNVTIRHAYNLDYYTPSWWEKLILYFTPLETHEHEGVVLTYKHFQNRMYIYGIRKSTYMSDTPSNGGVNKPWLN